MGNLDFTPLYRSTVGYDRVPHLLKTAMRTSEADLGYPPYNIERRGEDAYRIVIALAGFKPDDLEIITEQNRLTVRGKMADRDDTEYLHRGIAGRSFERRFELADHIEVKGASFDHGLLTISLKRELPERLKPRRVEIAQSMGTAVANKASAQVAA